MTRFSFFLWVTSLTLLFVGNVLANSYSQYVLKHRDATELQQAIRPLLSEGSYISIDNNTLLVSAPAAENKRIARLIKRLDKPQQGLLVSVFRGKHPYKVGSIVSTTDTKNNYLHKSSMQSGQTVALTERGLVNVAVMESAYYDAGTGGNVQDSVEGVAYTEQRQIVDLPTGVYIRVSLSGKQQAMVAAKVISANVSNAVNSSAELIQLSNSLDTRSLIPVAQWVKLSDRQIFSHQPELDSQRKVYSTDTSVDSEQTIWVRVETL